MKMTQLFIYTILSFSIPLFAVAATTHPTTVSIEQVHRHLVFLSNAPSDTARNITVLNEKNVASRRAYRNNRGAYRNNRNLNNKHYFRQNPSLRGNIYLPANNRQYRPSQQGNIIIDNHRHYNQNKHYRNRQFRGRQNRWINNRFYRWYIPAAGYLIYQGQPCYIENAGSGQVDDQQRCCVEYMNQCTDNFLIPSS